MEELFQEDITKGKWVVPMYVMCSTIQYKQNKLILQYLKTSAANVIPCIIIIYSVMIQYYSFKLETKLK